jgi:F-type H+-transporting ATPase subunit b
MIELNATLLIQLINFLVLLFLLNLILIRPIRRVIKERADRMSGEMTEIEEFNDRAQQKLEDYQAQLEKARQEGVDLRLEKKNEAKDEEREIVSQAESEARQELDSARQEIDSQVKAAEEKLTKEVKQFAKQVADKILMQT